MKEKEPFGSGNRKSPPPQRKDGDQEFCRPYPETGP